MTVESQRVLVNPPSTLLGRRNAIVSGAQPRYHVESFPGPLSIKSVVSGWGVWSTASGTYRVDPGPYVVLNAGRVYSLEIRLDRPVRTFCPFFEAGFVEAAYRALARVACLSAHHFHRTFRELFGRTPHGYLTALRLERARTLLAHTETPVTKVCLAVGFESLGSFSARFHREAGISPTAYRAASRRDSQDPRSDPARPRATQVA